MGEGMEVVDGMYAGQSQGGWLVDCHEVPEHFPSAR